MIYTTADEQKHEVSNLTNCSSYMELPKMPIKRVMKIGAKISVPFLRVCI
jgi:demethoxyubiquinone hydroxylase (CLK1/Coq7/Cat5 family)